MDKRTIIGIVLIIIVTLMMPLYQRWITGDQPPQDKRILPEDTVTTRLDTVTRAVMPSEEPVIQEESVPDMESETGTVTISSADEVKTINIESDLVNFSWSTERGGDLTSWELKKYHYYQGGNVNLINRNGMKLNFLNADGKEINMNDLNMFADFRDGKTVVLDPGNPEYELQFYLPVKNGRIVKTLRFYYDRYAFDMMITFQGLQDYVINRKYFVGWENGLPITEQNAGDDLGYSRAYTFMADELINIDASDKYGEEDLNGRVDWAAIRTKYFLVSFIPKNPSQVNGVLISGIKKSSAGMEEKEYNFTLDTQFQPTRSHTDTFRVFLGPLDYYILKKYDVELESLVMNKDWYERLFRPISLLIIPAFKFLYRFIPNYGFVIIIFSILIKLILHPLTKKSYQSMSEMQYLQPKMTELREKYKDEPQRLNKEMMRLYKEHGVNPLGGCLPMLLQMPVLFSLFIVFRSTIQLRNQPFILWINDLSAPDALHLGISLPMIGNSIHVLPIVMGITMIWQSKMSMTDPKQKFMIYFMPLFMIFIFYSLPSGLNLYYAIFNLLSMFQTRMIKKKMHPDGDSRETAKPSGSTKPARSGSSRNKRKK